jgi:hypothetical protein
MRRLLFFSILVVVTMSFMTVQSAEGTFLSATVQGKQTVYFAGHTLGQLQNIALANGIDPFDPFASPFLGDLEDPNTLPDAIDITGIGSMISISASGFWSHTPSPDSGPDGKGLFELTQPEYELFGVSLLGADLNMLAGVFLSDSPPIPGAPPPRLTLGDDMTTPMLNQAFAIGAELEEIIVPMGATRLYLGLHDGFEWTNNSGSVDVRIASAVPEPSTMLLLATGLIGLAGFRRKFKK